MSGPDSNPIDPENENLESSDDLDEKIEAANARLGVLVDKISSLEVKIKGMRSKSKIADQKNLKQQYSNEQAAVEAELAELMGQKNNPIDNPGNNPGSDPAEDLDKQEKDGEQRKIESIVESFKLLNEEVLKFQTEIDKYNQEIPGRFEKKNQELETAKSLGQEELIKNVLNEYGNLIDTTNERLTEFTLKIYPIGNHRRGNLESIKSEVANGNLDGPTVETAIGGIDDELNENYRVAYEAYEAVRAAFQQEVYKYNDQVEALAPKSGEKREPAKTNPLEAGFEKLGISLDELKQIPGFEDLNEAQRQFVLENLQQLILGDVKAGALQKTRADRQELLGKKEEVKSFWDVKNDYHNKVISGKAAWKNVFKNFYTAKNEQAILKEVADHKFDLYRNVITSLVDMAGGGPEVVERNGQLEINFLDKNKFTPELTPEQQSIIEKFNRAANRFCQIPEDWSFSSASNKEQKQYKEAQAEYRACIEEVRKLYPDKQTAAGAIYQAHGQIQKQRFINSNPEAARELEKIGEQSTLRRGMKIFIPERATTMATGVGIKQFFALSLASGLAAPLAGAAMGGWIARRRAAQELEENNKLVRRGAANNGPAAKDFVSINKEMTINQQGDKVKGLYHKLDILLNKFKKLNEIKTSNDTAAKKKLMESLKTRIIYVEGKIQGGLVDYGKSEERFANQLGLADRLAEANVAVAQLAIELGFEEPENSFKSKTKKEAAAEKELEALFKKIKAGGSGEMRKALQMEEDKLWAEVKETLKNSTKEILGEKDFARFEELISTLRTKHQELTTSERLNRFLGLHVDRQRKEERNYLLGKMAKGAAMGAAFAFGGYVLRWGLGERFGWDKKHIASGAAEKAKPGDSAAAATAKPQPVQPVESGQQPAGYVPQEAELRHTDHEITDELEKKGFFKKPVTAALHKQGFSKTPVTEKLDLEKQANAETLKYRPKPPVVTHEEPAASKEPGGEEAEKAQTETVKKDDLQPKSPADEKVVHGQPEEKSVEGGADGEEEAGTDSEGLSKEGSANPEPLQAESDKVLDQPGPEQPPAADVTGKNLSGLQAQGVGGQPEQADWHQAAEGGTWTEAKFSKDFINPYGLHKILIDENGDGVIDKVRVMMGDQQVDDFSDVPVGNSGYNEAFNQRLESKLHDYMLDFKNREALHNLELKNAEYRKYLTEYKEIVGEENGQPKISENFSRAVGIEIKDGIIPLEKAKLQFLAEHPSLLNSAEKASGLFTTGDKLHIDYANSATAHHFFKTYEQMPGSLKADPVKELGYLSIFNNQGITQVNIKALLGLDPDAKIEWRGAKLRDDGVAEVKNVTVDQRNKFDLLISADKIGMRKPTLFGWGDWSRGSWGVDNDRPTEALNLTSIERAAGRLKYFDQIAGENNRLLEGNSPYGSLEEIEDKIIGLHRQPISVQSEQPSAPEAAPQPVVGQPEPVSSTPSPEQQPATQDSQAESPSQPRPVQETAAVPEAKVQAEAQELKRSVATGRLNLEKDIKGGKLSAEAFAEHVKSASKGQAEITPTVLENIKKQFEIIKAGKSPSEVVKARAGLNKMLEKKSFNP